MSDKSNSQAGSTAGDRPAIDDGDLWNVHFNLAPQDNVGTGSLDQEPGEVNSLSEGKAGSSTQDQTYPSVEQFLQSKPSDALSIPPPRPKIGLREDHEQTAGLQYSRLEEQYKPAFERAVESFMEGTIAAAQAACEGRIKEAIKAEWDTRCRKWLNEQREEQRAEVRQEIYDEARAGYQEMWLQQEEPYFARENEERNAERRESNYHAMREQLEAEFLERWNAQDGPDYHRQLYNQVENDVRAKLRAELLPGIMAEVRAEETERLRGEIRQQLEDEHTERIMRNRARRSATEANDQAQEQDLTKPAPHRTVQALKSSDNMESDLLDRLPESYDTGRKTLLSTSPTHLRSAYGPITYNNGQAGNFPQPTHLHHRSTAQGRTIRVSREDEALRKTNRTGASQSSQSMSASHQNRASTVIGRVLTPPPAVPTDQFSMFGPSNAHEFERLYPSQANIWRRGASRGPFVDSPLLPFDPDDPNSPMSEASPHWARDELPNRALKLTEAEIERIDGPPRQTTNGPSQTAGSKRARAMEDEAGAEADDQSHMDQGEVIQSTSTKRRRLSPVGEDQAPSTRTRAAAKKDAAPNAGRDASKTKPALKTSGTSRSPTTPTASPSAAAVAVVIPPRRQPPRYALRNQTPAADPNKLKRGRDVQESDEEEDEDPIPPPRAKRTRRVVTESSAVTNQNATSKTNIGSTAVAPTTSPAFAPTVQKVKLEKRKVGRPKGKGKGKGKTPAAKKTTKTDPPPSKSEKAPKVLKNPPTESSSEEGSDDEL
ncbi:MAG: hypothetical protein Q9181_000291 [Wetmoreana brouardii]